MTEEKKEEEKKVNYINGAVTSMEKKGEIFEVTLYDNQGTYFCKNGIGIKVGSGYKFGIIDTDTKNRYEIVSVEQQIIKEPAFQIKGPQATMVQMTMDDYRELLNGKHIKIRAESLNAAIKICEKTFIASNPEMLAKKAKEIALQFEPYFE